MAKLHLICGNCGCNNMWEWEHIEQELDYPNDNKTINTSGLDCDILQNEDVHLWCKNCATLHSLNDNAKIREN